MDKTNDTIPAPLNGSSVENGAPIVESKNAGDGKTPIFAEEPVKEHVKPEGGTQQTTPAERTGPVEPQKEATHHEQKHADEKKPAEDGTGHKKEDEAIHGAGENMAGQQTANTAEPPVDTSIPPTGDATISPPVDTPPTGDAAAQPPPPETEADKKKKKKKK